MAPGIDPLTGMAVIGRYADGSPAHMKFYTPRYGTRHGLLSGTTGSGKSELLNLLIFIALAAPLPVVPVILDPQEGQSLPFWRDRVPVRRRGRRVPGHAGRPARGHARPVPYLSKLRWDDDGIADARHAVLRPATSPACPSSLIIFDEAHMLLTGNDQAQPHALVGPRRGNRPAGPQDRHALWLATQIPSLSDLGGSQALRDMLRGGNVVSMRTANRVAAGMLGLEKDPSEIPMFFADGKETYGLGLRGGPGQPA